MRITKALADENRIRALMLLQSGELCVCQIIEFFGLSPSTVSKHMSILKNAELVETRKIGRWVYYRLANENASTSILKALSWIEETLKSDPTIIADGKKLLEILKQHPAENCKK
jgi:ArsR family transcriptional regulator, arsenate/arsenite/antimonite-responsive transcriptional repressor